MGLYSSNTLSNLNIIEFPTVEGYVGTVGAGIALVEGYQNDFALFQAGISGDFAEIAAMQEGADLLPLQEASIKGFFDKIIEFFKKLGAKIKAIFTTFAAKMSSYFTKDNKDFVKKYEKVVFAGGRDYSKMKAKYSKPKGNGYTCPIQYGTFSISATNAEVEKDFDRDEAIEEALGTSLKDLKVTEISEIAEAMHNEMYEDEEVKDDWDVGDLNGIANRLKAGSKTISEIEKTNKNLQDTIKKVINELNKSQANFAKKLPAEGKTVSIGSDDGVSGSISTSKTDNKYGYTAKNMSNKSADIETTQKQLTRMQSKASAHQSCILSYCSAVMKEAKFGIAQDRRIFAQAASFRNVTKEDADLLAAIGEAVDFETESDFEAMDFIA